MAENTETKSRGGRPSQYKDLVFKVVNRKFTSKSAETTAALTVITASKKAKTKASEILGTEIPGFAGKKIGSAHFKKALAENLIADVAVPAVV